MTCYLSKLLEIKPPDCTDIHFVGDRYDFAETCSLKMDEHQWRAPRSKSREYIPSVNLEISEWKNLIGNPINKADLLFYITKSICRHFEEVPKGLSITFGGTGENSTDTVIVKQSVVVMLPELGCANHKEADTRLIAHVVYKCRTIHHARVVVHANDTDINLLCMYHLQQNESINQLWVQRNNKYLPIHELVCKLSSKYDKPSIELCKSLLVGYVLPGCDTVSFLFGRGKRKTATVALQIAGCIPHLATFGDNINFDVTDDIKANTRCFIGTLYG